MKNGPVGKFSLSLLARFALAGPNGPIDLPNKKLAGLLAYLACTAPVPQSREKLATLLWGSHFATQAQQNLRQALFRLRRVLGPDALISHGEEVWLAPGVIDCDAARLEALVNEGSSSSLAVAADLYQDPLLADVNIAEESWTDWVGTTRLRLENLALDAMVRHAEQALHAGKVEVALKAAYRAVAVNTLREDAHRLIVRALAVAGRKPEALKHYQDLVALLKRELNTGPDTATRSLVADIGSMESPAMKRAILQPAARTEGEAPASPDGPATVRSASPERRQLTIMICAAAGPLPLSASLDPEDMYDLVGAFHKAVSEAASRFDGFVAQYLGDGAHVYFGYPAAQEHDAERAVRAALVILDAVRALKAPSGASFQASVGIATGVVVVGERAGTSEMQRFAIGEAPGLAVQLQAAASSGEIMISAGTLQLVGRMFDCRAKELEGLPQSVEAWQVRGEMAGVSRFDARRSGALSPLVGRQEEVELLLRRWDQVGRGEGRVVLLSGEPGIGKSRIAEDLLSRLQGEPHVCFRYSCSPHHAHSPLYPFIAQLERSFEPGCSSSAKLDKLRSLFGQADNGAQNAALLAELLAIETDGLQASAIGPQQKRDMTLAALADQLDAAVTRGPVVILFEDIHWIDPTSLDMLNRIIARIAGLPALLVVTFRPELQPTWVGEPHVTLLPLRRLSRGDSAAIIGGVAGGKALPDALLDHLLAHADGVPLFIEELTSALLDSGLLRETTESYLIDGPLPALAVPTTLQASLVSRLDRLGPVRDLALIGAAIGREFSHELVAAVASLPAEELDAALERLTASGLVSRTGAPPAATYAFRHVLVQDAAYATLLKSRRRQLHSDIAKVLVERFPAMAERLPQVAAHHFTEASLAGEAIGYWRRAGQLASTRSAGREAVTCFEQALRLLETQPETRSTLELGCDLRLELRPALLEAGSSSQRMLECLDQAEALAERLDDDYRRAQTYASMTATHTLRGDLEAAYATGSRALDFAGRLGDLRTRIVATSLLVQVHHARGEYARVVELAPGNLAALPAAWVQETLGLGRPPSVLDRGWLVMSLAQLGRFAEAAEPAAEAIRLAAATKHPLTIGWAHFAAGSVPLRKGDWAQALEQYERVIAVCRAAKSFFLLPLALAPIPWVLAQVGETSKALERLEECEQLVARQAASGGSLGVFGPLFAWMGRAALVLGRLEEAQRLGAQAVEACQHHPGYAADALQLKGEIATHHDCFKAESAELDYHKALALAAPSGMRPLIAQCRLGLGKVYRRAGRQTEARNELIAATTMYREMDMSFWLKQAETEMVQLQAPS